MSYRWVERAGQRQVMRLEEGAWRPDLHPRGREGRWVDVLAKLGSSKLSVEERGRQIDTAIMDVTNDPTLTSAERMQRLQELQRQRRGLPRTLPRIGLLRRRTEDPWSVKLLYKLDKKIQGR